MEDLKERDEDAQKKEVRGRLWSSVAEFVSDNPTLAVTASYVYLTAIGLTYSASLYYWFGINILDYSEVADFLLGALKNLGAFIMALAQVVLAAILYVRLIARNEVLYRDDPQVSETMGRMAFMRTIAFLVYSAALPIIFASFTAFSIKAGQVAKVEVGYRSFKGSAGQVTVSGVELIGATQKTVFFYDPDERRTIVVPQAQLVSIEVPD